MPSPQYFPTRVVVDGARSRGHNERVHYSDKWRCDMKAEVDLGLAPATWSTSSRMNDPRPNGYSLFDARFVDSPMGRARAGRSIKDRKGT